MPKAKYEPIYRDIRSDIENGRFKQGEYLPSENEYCEKFQCTRNTIRRALSLLTSEGYLLPQHGKGVQVIYQPNTDKSLFSVGGIESFAEAAARNNKKVKTNVVRFQSIIADEKISIQTGFDIGTELFYIERVRCVNQKGIILDTNYFLKSEMPDLSIDIAKSSIYEYLENTLHMVITTSRRRVTAEKATELDNTLLDLDEFHFVLVVSGQVFNSKGIMFEYTQSRHKPDQVCFVESAVRQKI